MQTFRRNIKLLRDTIGIRLPLALFAVLVILALAIISRQQGTTNLYTTNNNFASTNEADTVAVGVLSVGAKTNVCNKLGINFAATLRGNDAAEDLERARRYAMGYSLSILTGTDKGAEDALVAEINQAHSRGITHVVRLCVNNACDSLKDPKEVAKFFARVSDRVCDAEFYVSTGPNEPNSETWLGGNVGDPGTYVPPVGAYSAALLKSLKQLGRTNIKNMTYIFNSDQPNFEVELNQFEIELGKYGVHIADYDIFAANIYNTNIHNIGDAIQRVKNAGITIPILVTETGMYERTQGVDEGTAFTNLKTQLRRIQPDPQVLGYLLFDAFATNPDSAFDYNFMDEADFTNSDGLLAALNCNGQSTPATVIAPECQVDPIDDLSNIAYDPPVSSGGAGVNSCNTQAGSTDTNPALGYCANNLIDGSFEGVAAAPQNQQEGSILTPHLTHAWYQQYDGTEGFMCGDYARSGNYDGNQATFCRPPEIIAKAAGTAGGGSCSQGLASQGNMFLKMFTASGSMNGGLCMAINRDGQPVTINSGKAGFDVKVNQDAHPAFGEVKVSIGYSNLPYDQINAANFAGVTWNTAVIPESDFGSSDGFATRSIHIDINSPAQTICIRANNQMALVGINTFWDGGYVTEGTTASCKTALEQSAADGISRQGGGLACNASCFPAQTTTKRARAEIFNPPSNYNLSSCQMAVAKTDGGDTPNGTAQPDGSLDGLVTIVNCGSEVSDPNFACASSEGITFGFKVVTTGPKQIPLLGYLSSCQPTDDNPFTTYCQLVSHRNFTPKDDNPLSLNYTNDTTGPFRIYGSAGTVQIEEAKLGTMSGVATVPWDFDDDLYINPKTLFKPNSTITNSDNPPPASSGNTGDSPISFLLDAIKEFFANFSGTMSDRNLARLRDVSNVTKACTTLPGGGFDYINTSDTVNFGEQNIILREENIEMTRIEAMDAMYFGGGKYEINGLGFKFRDSNDIFRDDGEKNLIDSGHMEARTYYTYDPVTDRVTSTFQGCAPKTYWGQELGNRNDPNHNRDCYNMTVKDLYNLGKSKGIPIVEVFTAKHPNGGEKFKSLATIPYHDSNTKTELPGLAKLIDTLYKLDQADTVEPVQNANKGIKIKVGYLMYDTEKVSNSVVPGGQVLGANTTINDFSGDYADTFEGFLLQLGIDKSFATSEMGKILAKSYKVTPYQTNVLPPNTYKVADPISNQKSTAAYYDYFFPWVGNIPTWLERYAYTQSNQSNNSTAKAFNGVYFNDPVQDEVPEGYSQNVSLDYCANTDPNLISRKDCYYKKSEYSLDADPVANWLKNYQGLDSPFVNDNFAGGNGNGGVCIPPANPPPTTTGTPAPTSPGGACLLDSVMGNIANPLDSAPHSFNSGAHVGTDMAIGVSIGSPVYAVAAGQVVFVRNMDIKDSQYENGQLGERSVLCGATCDWMSIPDATDSIIGYSGFWRQYGNVIGIKHADGVTIYAHLTPGSIRVNAGDCVLRNQQIAQAGTTGSSTGPHLHFEIRQQTSSCVPGYSFNGGICSRYAHAYVRNNNDVSMISTELSTPRTATSDPIPVTGGGSSGPIYCTTPGGNNNGGTGNNGTPQSGGLACLVKKAVDALNQDGSKIAPEVVFAIMRQETNFNCARTWDSWLAGERIECNGDANQTAFASRNGTAWDGRIANGLCAVDIRGLTQFAAASDNAGDCGVDTFNGIVSSYGDLMRRCQAAIGINNSIDPTLWADPYSKDAGFSRNRVGDAVCAAAIKLAMDGRSFNGGNFVSVDVWRDIQAWPDIQSRSGAWNNPSYNLGTNALREVARRYHGACTLGYCPNVNSFVRGYVSSGQFTNLNCNSTITNTNAE